METKNEIHMYVLTQEQINQIAAIAGKEAVTGIRLPCQMRQDSRKKNRLNLDGNSYRTLWGMQGRQ